MEYTLMLLKHRGDGLLGVILSSSDDERDAALSHNPTWELVSAYALVTDAVCPKAICNELLMTEETSDRLFRDIVDTWLGPTQDDPLNDYDRYASREESKTVLDKDYLDRLKMLNAGHNPLAASAARSRSGSCHSWAALGLQNR